MQISTSVVVDSVNGMLLPFAIMLTLIVLAVAVDVWGKTVCARKAKKSRNK